MLLALLSDIHANVRALDACLAHAESIGVKQYAFLGDLVGYGGEPGAVVDRIMGLAESGAIVLKGNHDELAAASAASASGVVSPSQSMDEAAASWTRQQLDAAQKQFLSTLPMTAQTGECLLVHASADAPEKWRYVDDARSAGVSLDSGISQQGVRHVFGGHVHHQTLYYRGTGRDLMPFKPAPGVAIALSRPRQWIATVGSVGQPRDGNTRAMYAVFDPAQARLAFFRVAYDHVAAAAAIRAAGQPEYFAQRLEDGR
jgi:diadenosine tetraphosphatase ApaH/serine/threonine PP2A family protein phosphatase